MYRNPSIASSAISDIRRELEERGCTEITLHRGGENIHVSAINPKKKKRVDIYCQPYVAQENKK